MISNNKVIRNSIFKRWYTTFQQQNPSVFDIFDNPDLQLHFIDVGLKIHPHHLYSVKSKRTLQIITNATPRFEIKLPGNFFLVARAYYDE